LLLSVLMSIVCAMINLDFAPQARQAYKGMLFELGKANLGLILPSGTFISRVPGYTIYIGKSSAGGELEDVSIYQMNEGRVTMAFNARRAKLDWDQDNGEASLTLFDGQQVNFTNNAMSACRSL
jgi:lipopolysaccharide export system permease protein